MQAGRVVNDVGPDVGACRVGGQGTEQCVKISSSCKTAFFNLGSLPTVMEIITDLFESFIYSNTDDLEQKVIK
jgi:hypothetical protein